jgi:hypothetical protein
MLAILRALDFGPREGDWCADDLCGGCLQALADIEAVNAGTASAISAVREAPTEVAAMAAYFDHLAALAGLKVGVEAEVVGTAGNVPGVTA